MKDLGAHDGFGVFEVGNGRRTLAVDLQHGPCRGNRFRLVDDRPPGGVGLTVAGNELHPHPPEDVVGDALGDRDVRVLGEPGRLEPTVGELVDEDFQRDTVLQADRDGRT